MHCNCNCCFAAKACIKQPFSQFCGGSGTEQSTSPTSYLKLQGHAKDKDSTQQLTLHHEDVGMGKQDSKEPNQLTSEIRCNWTVKESARAIHTRANNTNNHKHAQKHTQKYIYIYISCTYVKDAGMAGRFLLHKRPICQAYGRGSYLGS